MVSEDSQEFRWMAKVLSAQPQTWVALARELRFVIPEDGEAESAFPINETSYPSADPESFLLIVRTSHVVTAVSYCDDTKTLYQSWTASSGGYNGVSSI